MVPPKRPLCGEMVKQASEGQQSGKEWAGGAVQGQRESAHTSQVIWEGSTETATAPEISIIKKFGCRKKLKCKTVLSSNELMKTQPRLASSWVLEPRLGGCAPITRGPSVPARRTPASHRGCRHLLSPGGN